MPWTRVPIDSDDEQDQSCGLRRVTYVQALLETQRQLLAEDETVFLLGEGIDDSGGVFGSTLGLASQFPGRVLDSPIAENALTGVCAGAAMAGMHPIHIHMRVDFLPMAMDQLVNHAAKWHYMSNGQVAVPLVVRAIMGRGWGSAAQHSQGLHNLFFGVPGLKIVLPATPYDAKGLLRAAVYDGNPVLFLEHRWLYNMRGPVPEEPYSLPLGQAIIRRQGSDVTLVAVSHAQVDAAHAARILEQRGISVEIVDPRTLCPLDMNAILTSVSKTRRLVVADCAWMKGGFGAEIAAAILEQDPALLRAPLRRVGFPFLPTPASPVLEEAYYPSVQSIVDTIVNLMEQS